MILTVAACEASIALALIVVLYNRGRRWTSRSGRTSERQREGRGADGRDVQEAEPIEATPGPESYPHLTPAGVEPAHPVQPWIERRR